MVLLKLSSMVCLAACFFAVFGYAMARPTDLAHIDETIVSKSSSKTLVNIAVSTPISNDTKNEDVTKTEKKVVEAVPIKASAASTLTDTPTTGSISHVQNEVQNHRQGKCFGFKGMC